jgi:hypothetical protein
MNVALLIFVLMLFRSFLVFEGNIVVLFFKCIESHKLYLIVPRQNPLMVQYMQATSS